MVNTKCCMVLWSDCLQTKLTVLGKESSLVGSDSLVWQKEGQMDGMDIWTGCTEWKYQHFLGSVTWKQYRRHLARLADHNET